MGRGGDDFDKVITFHCIVSSSQQEPTQVQSMASPCQPLI